MSARYGTGANVDAERIAGITERVTNRQIGTTIITVLASVSGSSSLSPLDVPGWYTDDDGTEDIVWRVVPSARRTPPGQSGYELHTTIRGVHFWGYDIDGLSTDDETVYLDGSGLATCVIAGELPCHIEEGGRRHAATVTFVLDFKAAAAARGAPSAEYLRLSIRHGDRTYDVTDEWFEDGLQRLEKKLPDDVFLVCCVTCLFSDYSPGGHGTLGMDCHRGAKEQYLAVRSKHDYWAVPRTEEVMETHLCPEYQRRIPGTGYRG
ncbi:MAG TPA: DUF6304 family protein [Acidimicrobiia bacterium]|nr:DUF6304 family protein [Acidimicrobiia bacterium]